MLLIYLSLGDKEVFKMEKLGQFKNHVAQNTSFCFIFTLIRRISGDPENAGHVQASHGSPRIQLPVSAPCCYLCWRISGCPL